MLPVEIKTTERNVPAGNNEITVPKYLEGVVPRIFKKNKQKTRPVEAKFQTNAKVWKHSLDLSGYKPEEIQVNCCGGNTVSVTAEQRGGAGVRVRRTVFVPRGVDMCNISSFVSDEGRLVIQAPYLSLPLQDSCMKCSLKRKRSEYSGKSQETNNHEKKARLQSVDITNGTDSRSHPSDAEASLRHEQGSVSGRCSPPGNSRQERGSGKGVYTEGEVQEPSVLGDSPQEPRSPSIYSSEDEIESHPQYAKTHPDPVSSQATSTSSTPAKESPGSPCRTLQSPTPASNVVGLREGSNISYRDIGPLPAARRQSVVLSIPIDNFFPDRDDIVISLQGNTLTIKANRRTTVKNCQLSEMFLKELVFPSRFDCRSIKLAKDVRGSLIVSVEKNE